MRLLLVAALVLMLSSLALAATETAQVDPYRVSFDMNTDIAHQVRVMNVTENPIATTYSVVIETNKDLGAGITITAFKNYSDSTLLLLKTIAGMRMNLFGFNATVNDTFINGREGYFVTGIRNINGTEQKVFEASYWLDSIDCSCEEIPAGVVSVGRTNVGIRSTYPDDVTQNLLNNLKVELGQADQMLSDDMPPH